MSKDTSGRLIVANVNVIVLDMATGLLLSVFGTLISVITAYMQWDDWRRRRAIQTVGAQAQQVELVPRTSSPVATVTVPSPASPATPTDLAPTPLAPEPATPARRRWRILPDGVMIAVGAAMIAVDLTVLGTLLWHHMNLYAHLSDPDGTLGYNLTSLLGYVAAITLPSWLYIAFWRRSPRPRRAWAMWAMTVAFIGAALMLGI